MSLTVLSKSLTDTQFSSLANLVIARGDYDGGFQHSVPKIEAKVKQAYNCVQWNPFPVDFWSGEILFVSIFLVQST